MVCIRQNVACNCQHTGITSGNCLTFIQLQETLALNLQLLSYLRRICSQCFRHPQYLHVQYTNFELCVIYRSGETLLLSFDESLLSKPVNVATTMDTIQKEAKPQRST